MPDHVKHAASREPATDVPHAVVPDVRGDSEDVALEKLRLSGLRPGLRREELSNGAIVGSVIRTMPPSGSLVARGERVSYVVSRSERASARDDLGR